MGNDCNQVLMQVKTVMILISSEKKSRHLKKILKIFLNYVNVYTMTYIMYIYDIF